MRRGDRKSRNEKSTDQSDMAIGNICPNLDTRLFRVCSASRPFGLISPLGERWHLSGSGLVGAKAEIPFGLDIFWVGVHHIIVMISDGGNDGKRGSLEGSDSVLEGSFVLAFCIYELPRAI